MTIDSQVKISRKSNKKALVRELVLVFLRTAALVLIIALLLSRTPQEQNFQAVGVIIGMLVLATIYIMFFIRSVRAVEKSKFPNIRAGEAMSSSGILLLAIFASIYSVISLQDPEAFTEVLTPFSSMYFSLTILATVGFGDIAPHTVIARSVAMAQMVLDLVFIGVLVRVFANAAKRSRPKRVSPQESSD